jgi:hypothetical protein
VEIRRGPSLLSCLFFLFEWSGGERVMCWLT